MGQPMHVGNPALSGDQHNPVLEEDEWEYEYDENESEDLYLTLDLTTHVTNALATNATRVKHDGHNKGPAYASLPGNGTATAALNGNDPNLVAGHPLQIVDLHSQNPLVRLDDNIYNCYWSTDQGTQFHISEAGHVPNPRRPGTVLDVIGISQTRLIGKPAQIVPRQPRPRLATLGKSSANAISVGGESEDEHAKPLQPISADTNYGEPLRIDKSSCRNDIAKSQASFLERLSEIKLKKGETDQVPVISVRHYDVPANADQLREAALAKDAEKGKRHAEVEPQRHERHKLKRHRPTNAERGIVTSNSAGNAPVAVNGASGLPHTVGSPFIPYGAAPGSNFAPQNLQEGSFHPSQDSENGVNFNHGTTRFLPRTSEQATTVSSVTGARINMVNLHPELRAPAPTPVPQAQGTGPPAQVAPAIFQATDQPAATQRVLSAQAQTVPATGQQHNAPSITPSSDHPGTMGSMPDPAQHTQEMPRPAEIHEGSDYVPPESSNVAASVPREAEAAGATSQSASGPTQGESTSMPTQDASSTSLDTRGPRSG